MDNCQNLDERGCLEVLEGQGVSHGYGFSQRVEPNSQCQPIKDEYGEEDEHDNREEGQSALAGHEIGGC